MLLKIMDGCLAMRQDRELLKIMPWGKNSLRVYSTRDVDVPMENWALLPQKDQTETQIAIENGEGTITNGKITAKINIAGMIYFYGEDGQPILREYWRSRTGQFETMSALEIRGRDFAGIRGGDYELTMRFEANPDEHIYGMGQYQDGMIDKKGCVLELAHRNSQASVPFYLSSEGYGFLWNNPSVGSVTFARNRTEWYASSTKALDYWISASDSPAEIMSSYADATGHPPMMPDYAMGFWQCKLRYTTQDELLEVARHHKALGLPMDVIVSDFFHWPYQGDWRFDETEWPDPDAMVKELKNMGIELMVSIWPFVDEKSENYAFMRDNGYLAQADRGIQITSTWKGNTMPYDPTNPEARKFVWDVVKRNYFDKGIRIFWLDEAEPEWGVYDFDHFRYAKGSVLQIGNLYPLAYAQNFFEGLKESGVEKPINLLRCAWAGSQRYGALVWSGDIDTTFRSFKEQFSCGLSMAMSGIPWWTSDIGGFHGGDQNDPDYRELLVRWFQFGAFCPVFRLHGSRKNSTYGGTASKADSGGPNEVWSYGEETYEILKKYLFLREEMKPYIKAVMQKTADTGCPVIRPLYFDFPKDMNVRTIEDQMMFGDDVLVAPVFELGARARRVYLPKGAEWIDAHSGEAFAGGQTIMADAPLERCPVFIRKGAEVTIKL